MQENKKDIFVVVGPVGSGKTAIIAEVLKEWKMLREKQPNLPDIGWPTSTTTRRPRPEDAEKPYYRFVSRETFEEWQKQGLFAWTTPPQRGGELYGTLKSDLESFLESQKIGLFPLHPESAKKLKADRIYGNRTFVFFVMVPEGTRRQWMLADQKRAESPEEVEIGISETRGWLDHVRREMIADFYLQNRPGELKGAVASLLNLIKYHSGHKKP